VPVLVRVFSLLLLLVVPACAPEEKEPLRLGTLLWPGSEPFFLARDLGLLDERAVRLVEYSSLTEVNRDFRNGVIDAVNVSLDMALLYEQSGFKPHVVLVLDASHGADALVARPELRTLADLRGRRVAVEDLAVSTYVLGRALEQAGLAPSDVEILRIPVDEHVRAYTAGEVDAVVTFEPFVSKLVEAGATRLFDSTQLPGEVLDVLVVREDRLDEHRAQLEHLTAGWFQALHYFEAHPDEALARMGPRLQITPTALASALESIRLLSLQENLQLLREPSSPSSLVTSARQLEEFMLEHGLLHGPVRHESLLDASILEKVHEGPP
jgi:NitT/TauT family transport system substrate-binding protein